MKLLRRRGFGMSIDKLEKNAVRRNGIQSLEIGLKVLDTLVSLGQPSSLSTIAQGADMSASLTHRYLTSLINAGMAKQDETNGRYRLGPATMRLGLATLARTDPFATADQMVGAFSRESGATIQIAALGPMGPTIVRWFAGSPPLATSLAVGSLLPLIGSATGNVFLAYTPEAETHIMVQREITAGRAPSNIDIDEIRRLVTADGFAHVSATVIPGLRATSMPILDIQGRAVLSATLLNLETVDPAWELTVRRQLTDVCRRVSESIGYLPA